MLAGLADCLDQPLEEPEFHISSAQMRETIICLSSSPLGPFGHSGKKLAISGCFAGQGSWRNGNLEQGNQSPSSHNTDCPLCDQVTVYYQPFPAGRLLTVTYHKQWGQMASDDEATTEQHLNEAATVLGPEHPSFRECWPLSLSYAVSSKYSQEAKAYCPENTTDTIRLQSTVYAQTAFGELQAHLKASEKPRRYLVYVLAKGLW
ncbi:hypothetical protein HispidOSU_027210 [Sigmodon hispidus]